MKADLGTAPEALLSAVADLSEHSGYEFEISHDVVPGTEMYVVYTRDHPFSEKYTVANGVLGFRVPKSFPNANPEDTFFIQPADIMLKEADPVRKDIKIHRAGPNSDFVKGTVLADSPVLVFSWHLWNKVAWKRGKHTLFDHYTHCLRRFEQPEHD